jgi:HK97 family phage portal protein
MNWWKRKEAPEQKAQFEDVLSRIIAAQEGRLGQAVTPETCMQSPTVHAIVTAISRRLAVTPIHVYRKGMEQGRDIKERLPSHPVARLLAKPNNFQTSHDFWADASSCFVRHGNFYAYKARGSTGPIRELVPLHPDAVEVKQDNQTGAVTYRVRQASGEQGEYSLAKMFHARGPARNFIQGDSPVRDVQLAIALEIMAEKFGATFFQNGAMPLMIFKFMAGAGGFRTKEEEQRFVQDFQAMLGGQNRHRAMLLPKNIETGDPVRVENDKAQFLETRKYQRTVIAGAFGVPPHLVGDLERATFNNVEQQDKDFTLNVIMPVAHAFEAAMERDLLTDADRASGICVRFNLDSILRADFKSRQEGLKIQREMGVINSNEWREIEGKNPREGGDDYYEQGPSGQNADREEPRNEDPISDDTAGS